jgi:hypothetical protein
MTTLRTRFDFSLVFGHFDRHGRNIKHLSFLISLDPNRFKRGLTLLTDGHRMPGLMVGAFDRNQGPPWVPHLSPWLLATRLAQALGPALGLETITRRGFTTIVTVFCQLVCQRLQPRRLLLDLGLLLRNNRRLMAQIPHDHLNHSLGYPTSLQQGLDRRQTLAGGWPLFSRRIDRHAGTLSFYFDPRSGANDYLHAWTTHSFFGKTNCYCRPRVFISR